MVVNTPAVPLYLQSKNANLCTANNENFFCVTSATDTTAETVGYYLIGLTWENPDSTGAALFDGLKMEIDIDVKAPLGSEIACGQADPTETCTKSYTFATSVDGPT